MSLLAWYKLDGNTKNSGISDHSLTTVTGVTTDGFSYQFDGTTNCNVHGPELTTTLTHRSFSLCAWIKTPGLATNQTKNGIISIGYGLTLDAFDNAIRIIINTSDTSQLYIYYQTPSIILSDNYWHNVICTYNSSSLLLKIYLDGNLVGSKDSVQNKLYYTNNVYIGTNINDPSYTNFNGSIRDVRIYDNCLSDVEIKDISKGLILHYDFNEPFEPYTNLDYNDIMQIYNNFAYNNNVTVTKETLANETYKGAPIYRLHFTINTESGLKSSTATSETNFLNSFHNELGSHGIYTSTSYTFKANTKYCYQIYWRAITHKKNMIVGGVISDIGNWTAIQSQKIDDEWNLVGQYRDGTVTSDKTDHIFTSFKNTDFKVGEEIIIDFAAPMLVKGKTTFTDFSIYDSSYDGTVYDVSGFNKNGEILSQSISPIYVKDDTAIGGSYALFSGAQYINTKRQIMNVTDFITIGVWIYYDGSTNPFNGRILSCTDNGGFCFYSPNGETCQFWVVTETNGYTYSASGSSYETLSIGWHFVVGTYDGYSVKVYIDGKLDSSTSNFSSVQKIKYNSSNYLFIGVESEGIVPGNASSLFYNGRIADVKIYATALSADDILKLYKSRFEIDNAQKLLVNTIKENTVDNILYNGDFHNGNSLSSSRSSLVTTEVFNNVLEINNINTPIFYELYKINKNDVYEISFDIKILKTLTTSDPNIYLLLEPSDSGKYYVWHHSVYTKAGTLSVLTKDLKSGDTSIEIESSSNWQTNGKIGICDNFIWGYNRCTYLINYASLSGNVLTLATTYSGSTISAGTKVANFVGGNTYLYPIYFNATSPYHLIDIWYHFSTIIETTNDLRWNYTDYINIGFITYNADVLIANLKIRNISNPQNLSIVSDTINLDKTQLLSSGNTYSSSEFSEVGIPIRYIRDNINGNTVNTGNHWVEIEAFNDVDNNIAYNKKVKMTSESSFTLRACASGDLTTTDPNYSNLTYISGDSTTNPYIVMDLEFVEVINKIKVWHYYNDGRTYHNHKIEVSADGTNWTTIYNSDITGEVAETSDGIEVILDTDKVHMFKQGQLSAHEFIER